MEILEHKINGKPVREYLSSDPLTDTKSVYELVNLLWYLFPKYSRSLWFQSIEENLKKQYQRFITGIEPSGQKPEDIAHISLLEALIFFREIGKEAECIVQAINFVWLEVRAGEKLDAGMLDKFWTVLNRANEGDQFARDVMSLVKAERIRWEEESRKKEVTED